MISFIGSSLVMAGESKRGNNDGDDDTQFRYSFFEASKEKILGNLLKAEQLFLHCVELNGKEPAPHYELANIYFLSNSLSQAVTHAEKAYKLDESNIWYRLFLADLYLKTKKYKESAAIFESLVEDYPNYIDYYFDWAAVYLNAGKLKNALVVYDKIEQIIGVTEELSIQKERIYLNLDKLDEAVKEIEKLIVSNPNKPEYYELLSELYRANNKLDKAMEVMDLLLKVDPENAFVHLFLYDYYRNKGEFEKSNSELKLAFGNSNVDLKTKMGIMVYYLQITETNADKKAEAFELFDLLIEAHPQDAEGFTLYGDFLEREGKIAEAREKFRQAVAIRPDMHQVWRKIIFIGSTLKDSIALLSDSQSGIDLFPSVPFFYMCHGVANIQLKKFDEAIESLVLGRDVIIDQIATSLTINSLLGDAYNEVKNFEESDKAYDAVLRIDSNNIAVLNNYSYYLSLRKDNMERAKEMSMKTNVLDSNNATYLDTYGWILYQMDDFAGAIIWLQKAIDNGGDDHAVIVEHLGDAQFKLGKKELGIQNWIKAKELGKGSDLLEEKILKKDLVE